MSNEIISSGQASLGIEFGSTRIKAVLIGPSAEILGIGWHDWENSLVDGIWTYSLDEVHAGLAAAYASLARDVEDKHGVQIETLKAMGVSAMMHGYMPFDEAGQLLTPFRTWRNTMTAEAASILTGLLGANIPQRWSIAHLYQAMLGKEEHVSRIDYLTTLAGYVHWRLTGEKILGVGDAVGMFPVDAATNTYDTSAVAAFDELAAEMPWNLLDILPEVRVAGEQAGTLSADGAALLDPTGTLQAGVPFCPPEGDAGTGMMATNAVEVRTGNISAGTSIFGMVVLEKPLSAIHEEIDVVTTPDGLPVAMVHCNNCSGELDAWVGVFGGLLERLGVDIPKGKLYDTLYEAGRDGEPDGDGMVAFNYLSGEHMTGLAEGRPLYARSPQSKLSLENFMRIQLMSMFATLRMGMEILTEDEGVSVDKFIGHGGIFKTPKIAQQILAGALNTPIAVGDGAGEGGAWGIAMLANYVGRTESLSDYLAATAFADAEQVVVEPEPGDVEGYSAFVSRYKAAIDLQKKATEVLLG